MCEIVHSMKKYNYVHTQLAANGEDIWLYILDYSSCLY